MVFCAQIQVIHKACFWDGTKCLEKTCSNKPIPLISQADCNSWLIKCQYNSNNNRCLENCTQADISNKTHELCESYYLNISCTVKLDIIQCVDLPIACSLAKNLNVIKINLEVNASIKNQKVSALIQNFQSYNILHMNNVTKDQIPVQLIQLQVDANYQMFVVVIPQKNNAKSIQIMQNANG
ncbi:unnamed protein product [Paramecium octaurelia]|uniref:Uncharacterized protein n=1 Tax=Paramecium octaurelia TaxID=43137 RepID=A0A8S1YHT5_PAROT|nr:unnamed protein product [Paramecium octaurelia]